MALGPVDVYIIGFPGNNFTGRVAPAILEQVESGTIRLLDVLLVIKNGEGNITAFELSDLGGEVGPDMTGLELGQPGALGKEDAEVVADELPDNSSALLIAFENVWAAKLVGALAEANAQVIDYVRIPADVAEAVITS